VDGSKISLLARDPEQDATAATETRATDDRQSNRVVKSAVTGGTLGAFLGGVAGFIGGLAAFGIPGIGPVIGTGIWVASASGTAFGAGLGATLGGVAALPVSGAWDLAQHVQAGSVLVGVHSDDAKDIEHAEEILGNHAPLRLDRFGGDGRLQSARAETSG
jgi:hypothetical protein